jgi:hypothetical protein
MLNVIHLENAPMRTVGAKELTEQPWNFESNQEKALNAKLSAGTIRLLDLPADMGAWKQHRGR